MKMRALALKGMLKRPMESQAREVEFHGNSSDSHSKIVAKKRILKRAVEGFPIETKLPMYDVQT
eukprot:3735951-Amphidinium_carterae.2